MTVDEAIAELLILSKHGYGKCEVSLRISKAIPEIDFDWSIGRCKAKKYAEESTWGIRNVNPAEKSESVPVVIPGKIW